MEDRAQKTSLKQQLGSHGIEDGLRLRGNPIHFKVLVHDQKNIEIFRGWFRGDKATPDEDPTQFPGSIGEIQECPKTS
jgi:hypothetical protein